MKAKRIGMSFWGVIICGISVGFYKLAGFGVDPFQSFMSGMDQISPISFGLLYMLVNAVMLAFALIFDRHYIGLATFINLFLLGYVVEFSHAALLAVFPDASIAIRCASFVFGFLVQCFSLSLYITADLGVSTYDAAALVIVNKWGIGQFRFVRIISDLSCVALGIILFLLGGGALKDLTSVVGIGTIICASLMGPVVDLFNRKFSVPFLERSKQ